MPSHPSRTMFEFLIHSQPFECPFPSKCYLLTVLFFRAGDSSEHPLFCVEYSPYCSSLLSPLSLSPIPITAASSCHYCHPPPHRQAGHTIARFPPFLSPLSFLPGPRAESPATLCYFPVSSPRPMETPCAVPAPAPDSPVKFTWCGKWPSAGREHTT